MKVRKLLLLILGFAILSGYSSFYSYLGRHNDGDWFGSFDAAGQAMGGNAFVNYDNPLNIYLNPSIASFFNTKAIGLGFPIVVTSEKRTDQNKELYLNQTNIYLKVPQVAIVYPLSTGLKSAFQFGFGLMIGPTTDYAYLLSRDILNSSGVKEGHQQVEYKGYVNTISLASSLNYRPYKVNLGLGLDLNMGRKKYQDDVVYMSYDVLEKTNSHISYDAKALNFALKMGVGYRSKDMDLFIAYALPHRMNFEGDYLEQEGQTYTGGETLTTKSSYTQNREFRYPGNLAMGLNMRFEDEYKTRLLFSVINQFYGSQYQYNNAPEPHYKNITRVNMGFSHLIKGRALYYGVSLVPSYDRANELSAVFFSAGTRLKFWGRNFDFSMTWGSREFTHILDEVNGGKEKVTESVLTLLVSTGFGL